MYSFNTGDNQDFYVIATTVTTTSGLNETWVNPTTSTQSPCEGTTTKARLGYSCTANQPLCLGIDISSTSTEGNCCSQECKTCVECTGGRVCLNNNIKSWNGKSCCLSSCTGE